MMEMKCALAIFGMFSCILWKACQLSLSWHGRKLKCEFWMDWPCLWGSQNVTIFVHKRPVSVNESPNKHLTTWCVTYWGNINSVDWSFPVCGEKKPPVTDGRDPPNLDTSFKVGAEENIPAVDLRGSLCVCDLLQGPSLCVPFLYTLYTLGASGMRR